VFLESDEFYLAFYYYEVGAVWWAGAGADAETKQRSNLFHDFFVLKLSRILLRN